MIKKISLFVCMLILLQVSAVYATIYTFYATPITANGDFSFQYDDADKNGRVSLSEIIDGSTSGTLTSPFEYVPGQAWPRYISRVYEVPTYDQNITPLTDGTLTLSWRFVDNLGAMWEVSADQWSYTQVPLPPTVWLLASGLLGLAGWRKLKKG